MPATHRLDVIVVPDRSQGSPLAIGRGVWPALEAAGVVDGRGGPGPRAAWMLPGGFVRARFDDPGAPALYANQQGGFRATCPRCDASVAARVGVGVTTGALTCDGCGATVPIEQIAFRPPAAVGRYAVVFADAGGADLSPDGAALLTAHLGPSRVVWRRPAW